MRKISLDAAVSEILTSLEYSTEKEESFVNDLLTKYAITRQSSLEGTAEDICSKIERKEISFEDFFSDILNYFRPFSLMIETIYEFLNSYSATIDSRASQFKFDFKKLQRKLIFDISNFPKELIHTFSYRKAIKLLHTYEINLMAKGDYDKKSPNETAIRFITGYDGDFYNFFLTPVSYFWAFKERTSDPFLVHEFNLLEREVDDVFENVGFLLDSLIEQQKLETRQIDMPYWGKFREEVVEFNEENKQMRLKRGLKLGEDLLREYRNRGLEYQLNCLALALQFWRCKYRRSDFERHNWAFRNEVIQECLENPEAYINLVKKRMAKYQRALRDIIVFKGHKKTETIVEDILEFVRLPYWKYRWHIYELWTLFLCLNIASAYRIRLNLKDHGDYLELIVPKAVAKEPVAKILNDQREIQCWFQRKTANPMTAKGIEPDLRFMTKDLYPTDIFVIENKDRRNCSGSHVDHVRDKYLSGTAAKNIWIVNYENYSRKDFSKKIHREIVGDRSVWVASNFKPTKVPQEFSSNFKSALTDCFYPQTTTPKISYDLIVDKSGSMDGKPIFPTVESISNSFNYNPDNIYLFDTDLTKMMFNDIEKFKDFIANHLKCDDGTELVISFEQYLRSKNEFPKLIYVLTDGDGLDECYEKYNLEMLNRGSTLVFIKI